MGKSAGNAPIELIAMYLNENYGKGYDINQLLEAIDTNILRIYEQSHWGYNLLYYLSASNDCHPNYIDYLLSKKTLSVKAVNECIEKLYVDYQNRITSQEKSIKEFVDGKKLLLLGPGKTLSTRLEDIQDCIQRERPLVIAVNFIPKGMQPDVVFISNSKRYSMLLTEFVRLKEDIAIIATSNVTSVGKPFDYVMDYARLLDSERVIEDNSFIMLMNALSECEPASVTLAGFDGFSEKANENYYDDEMEISNNYERLSKVNKAIAKRIPCYREKMELTFLTPSIYEKG